VYHVVEQGEYPLAIANIYKIAVDSLLEANQISDPTGLQIGQELIVPVTVTPTPKAPTATPTPRFSPTPTPEPVLHVIEAGDTLMDLAVFYDTSIEVIMLANEVSDPRRLQVGQEILIPPDSVTFDTPTVVYEIEGGDTLSRLALKYGSTVDDLLAANPDLEPTSLRIGQQIIIPITSPPINPDADPQLPQITSPEVSLPSVGTVQQQVVQGVNSQRRQNGLPDFSNAADLSRLALVHAQDMVKRGYFAHVTPDGVSLRDRFKQQGIVADWVGENIQRNTKPEAEAATEALYWFMNSAPHRANILHSRYNSIGVGVVEGPAEWYTFVLVFAQK
jgi:uncharacterized protein YkwD